MSHNIRREAADIADGLDNGDGRWAADRLRQDLQQMHPDQAMELLRQIQSQERQGYGSDLIVDRVQGRRGQEFLSVNVESLIYDRRRGEQIITQQVGMVPLPYYDQHQQPYPPGRYPQPYPGHGGHHGGHRRGGDDDIVPFLGGVAVGTVLGILLNNGSNRRGRRR